MPANETLSDYLKRRDGELSKLDVAIRARLERRERELNEVRKVGMSLGLYANALTSMAVATAAIKNSMAPNNENLRDFLTRRDRELTQQVSAIRGELAPVEAELAEIRRAKSIMSNNSPTEPSEAAEVATQIIMGGLDPKNTKLLFLDTGMLSDMFTAEGKTIKDLVVLALKNHFHQGAKPAELRDYIKNAYGRDVALTSISPQLSRLKEEGWVEQYTPASGKESLWKLTSLAAIDLLYDLPSTLGKPEP
jgi:hypothetical protein